MKKVINYKRLYKELKIKYDELDLRYGILVQQYIHLINHSKDERRNPTDIYGNPIFYCAVGENNE